MLTGFQQILRGGLNLKNAIVVNSNNDLQAKYDLLKSSDRDGQMGAIDPVTNKRVLLVSPGTYDDALTLDTPGVSIQELIPGTVTFTGAITITANNVEIPPDALYLGDVSRTAWTAANHYDNIHAGGWGYFAINGDAVAGSTSTTADLDNPINLTGTLTRIKVRLYTGTSWVGGKTVKFKVLRGTAPNFTLVGEVDITTEADAAATIAGAGARFALEVDISASAIAVQPGDYIAFTLPTTSSTGLSAALMNAGGIDLVYGTGDTETLDGTRTGYSAFCASVYIDDSTLYYPTGKIDVSAKGNGDIIALPAYETEPYYIVLKDVNVPDGETMAIALDYTDAVGDNATAETITIDFSGGVDDGKILLTTGSASKDLVDKDVAQLTGVNLELFIWFDPTNEMMEVLWTSYYTTTGPQGVALDLRIASITDRTPYSVGVGRIDRLTLTNAGGNATIEDLVVCRNPVVCGIDSFVAKYSTDHLDYTRISPLIDDVGIFPQPRYPILAGVNGNRLLTDSDGNHSAFITRWDTAGSDQDIIAFRDVTYLLCLNVANDIGDLDDSKSEARSFVKEYLDTSETIIQGALNDANADGGANELIIVGPIGDPSAYTYIANLNRKFIYKAIDDGLKRLCEKYDTPYVSALQTFQNTSDALFASTGDIHPGTDGTDWITKMAAAKWTNANETY